MTQKRRAPGDCRTKATARISLPDWILIPMNTQQNPTGGCRELSADSTAVLSGPEALVSSRAGGVKAGGEPREGSSPSSTSRVSGISSHKTGSVGARELEVGLKCTWQGHLGGGGLRWVGLGPCALVPKGPEVSVTQGHCWRHHICTLSDRRQKLPLGDPRAPAAGTGPGQPRLPRDPGAPPPGTHTGCKLGEQHLQHPDTGNQQTVQNRGAVYAERGHGECVSGL